VVTSPSPLAQAEISARLKAQTLAHSWTSGAAQHLASVVSTNPRRGAQSVLERPDVVARLSGSALLDQVNAQLSAAFEAGWALGSQEWSTGGGPPAPGLSGSSPYLDAVRERASLAIAQAQTSVTRAVWTAFEEVGPGPSYQEASGGSVNVPATTAALRAAHIRQGIEPISKALALRLQMSVTSALYRGRGEAQIAAASALQSGEPGLGIYKKWITTSPTPCGSCLALEGLGEIPVDSLFDVGDSVPGAPAVFGNLSCPPRHPNCRCRLVIVAKTKEEIQPVPVVPPPPPAPQRPAKPRVVPPPVPTPPAPAVPSPAFPAPSPEAPGPVYMTAEQVRALPEPEYRSVVSLLKSALKRLLKVLFRG
jgi:hypothetical protein